MLRWLVLICFFLVPLVGFTQASEQIPAVHEEEHHQPLFETNEFRLLKVAVDAGEACEYHIHKNNISYVAISGADLLMDSLNSGKTREVSLPNGWIGRNDEHAQIPMAHRFTNMGSSDLLIFAVEFLESKSSDFQIEKYRLEADEYSMQLEPGEFLFYDEAKVFTTSSNKSDEKGWLFAKENQGVYLYKTENAPADVYCLRRVKE